MNRLILATLLLCLVATAAEAAVIGNEVTYSDGEITMKGYLAYNDSIKGAQPGILVVHEWWGHNAYARKRAEMLAQLGYTALAVDMYGGGRQADHPKTAGKFAGELRKNMPKARKRFEAGMKVLAAEPRVDAARIAAIGYCFGGGMVLEMARMGVDLKAVASFHGSLGSSQKVEPGTIKARILVANGADDPFTKPEQIAAFKQQMDAAGADYRFINYPGAKHSFTNPDADQYGARFKLPLAYNAAADHQSWQELQQLLKEVFGSEEGS